MDNHYLTKRFKTFDLITYSLPTMIMLLFINLYTSIDGIFVSNYVSTNALSAINIVIPYWGVILALGLMLSTGANAIIAKQLGEKKSNSARSFFSLVYIVGIVVGVIIAILSYLFTKEILHFLGATEKLYKYAKEYLDILIIFTPIVIIKVMSETFFITVGKPKLGMLLSVSGGILNIIFDYIFIKLLGVGIAGAAYASCIGYSFSGIISVLYFSLNRKCSLHFTKPKWNGKQLLYSCFNGSSEFINNISISITTYLFNIAMLKYLGEIGVAAISIILYLEAIVSSIFVGFSCGISPIISFKHGEKAKDQLINIMKTSFIFTIIISAIIVLLSIIFADFGVGIFVSKHSKAFDIARNGFLIFTTSNLFMGVNILICSTFTAFGNGKVSAILSILRSLIFIAIGIQVLPMIWGINAIWFSVPIAEMLTLLLSIYCFNKYKKEYFL